MNRGVALLSVTLRLAALVVVVVAVSMLLSHKQAGRMNLGQLRAAVSAAAGSLRLRAQPVTAPQFAAGGTGAPMAFDRAPDGAATGLRAARRRTGPSGPSGRWYIRVDGDGIGFPRLEARASRPPRGRAVSISAYDDLIIRQAKAAGFDWRLIAAVIFEESGFDPASKSNRGAYGLMQVRDVAARAVGQTRFKAPADNVRAGVQYLRYLSELFPEATAEGQVEIILAAYNMGPAHIRDAQGLAERRGYDPNRWVGAMEEVLPLLEQPAIYTTLTHGFARGDTTVAYVQRVVQRFRDYRALTTSGPVIDADARSSSAAIAANG
jgi:soluble lytic murein transglycosylase-like protein